MAIRTVCYIRYRSKICPNGRPPITKKVEDVEAITPKDIIVAVRANYRKGYLYLHLDRVTNEVWLMQNPHNLTFASKNKKLVGIDGEFVTP